MLKVTVFEDGAGEWRWRATNGGRIVADSAEGYSRKYDARRAWARFFSGVMSVAKRSASPRKPAKRKGRR